MNTKSEFDANFTAGGILYHEFLSLKNFLKSENFIELIKLEQEQNNYIGVPTKSARKRIISEIIRRYKNAPEGFWSQLFEWNEVEQKLALFFLCLKTYPLIFDLHFEVTIKKFRTGSTLTPFDLQMRLDEIASFDDNVAGWSAATLKKINVQYRKALKDVGLYNGKSLNRESKAGVQFWNYFKSINETWFLDACFVNN